MNCVSCNNSHDEKYCPNCGEKSGVKRITLASMIEEVFSSITNMDRGFLYNLKTLTLNPQKITTDYIHGKRKGILNPVSYLIYAITIYIIIIIIFDAPKDLFDVNNEPRKWLRQLSYDVGYFIRVYLKYFWILSIIPLALSLKLVFRKYNYLEYLTISSLIIGHATLLSVLSYMIFSTKLIFDPLVYFVIFLLIFKICRGNKTVGDSLFWSFLVLLMFVFELIIIVIIIGIIKANY